MTARSALAKFLSKTRRKKSKGRRESEVLARVMAYLDTRRDVYWWRNQTGGARIGDAFLKFGKKGSADILCCQAPWGRMIGIETKRQKGGVLSADQLEWGQQLAAHGGRYIVARSVEDVQERLGVEQACITKPPSGRTYPRS